MSSKLTFYLTTSNIGYLSPSSTTQPPPGPLPPNNVNISLSFIPPVVFDAPPLLKSFGAIATQPKPTYTLGDVVNTTFIGANPRNNLRLEGTFAAVEMQNADATWTQIRDDADWSLVYTWYRDDVLLGTSHVVVSWETGAESESVRGLQSGTYRIRYFGDAKSLGGEVTAFEGVSGSFSLA